MRRVKVYESDGSDGYSPGTWGWMFDASLDDGRESTWHDGGYASRRLAEHAGERRRRDAEGG